MRLTLRTSGGFANIRLQGEIDTDELEESFARTVLEALSPDRLAAAADPASGTAVDTIRYELILHAAGRAEPYVIDEGTAPRDVTAVLQRLTRELIRRRRTTS